MGKQKSSKNGDDRVYLATRVAPETARKLKQIAKRTKRRVSAEMDFALTQYTASEP